MVPKVGLEAQPLLFTGALYLELDVHLSYFGNLNIWSGGLDLNQRPHPTISLDCNR